MHGRFASPRGGRVLGAFVCVGHPVALEALCPLTPLNRPIPQQFSWQRGSLRLYGLGGHHGASFDCMGASLALVVAAFLVCLRV